MLYSVYDFDSFDLQRQTWKFQSVFRRKSKESFGNCFMVEVGWLNFPDRKNNLQIIVVFSSLFLFYHFVLHLLSKQSAFKYLGQCQNQRGFALLPSCASPWKTHSVKSRHDTKGFEAETPPTFPCWHWRYVMIRLPLLSPTPLAFVIHPRPQVKNRAVSCKRYPPSLPYIIIVQTCGKRWDLPKFVDVLSVNLGFSRLLIYYMWHHIAGVCGRSMSNT